MLCIHGFSFRQIWALTFASRGCFGKLNCVNCRGRWLP